MAVIRGLVQVPSRLWLEKVSIGAFVFIAHFRTFLSFICMTVDGCNMPLSIVGGHRGSYRTTNPQLSQTVESLKMICQSLNQSKELWWRSATILDSVGGEVRQHNFQWGDATDCSSGSEGPATNVIDNGEEIIDLQANDKRESKCNDANQDCDGNDGASIDSDDSIWNKRS